MTSKALAGWFSWLEHHPINQNVAGILSLVRALTSVVGSISSWGTYGRKLINVFLSLFSSLLLSLSPLLSL